MSKRQVVYTITVTVNEGGMSEAAARIIPKLVRQFAVLMKVKLALVGSVSQWSVTGLIERSAGGLSWEQPEEMDLTLEGNEDDEAVH